MTRLLSTALLTFCAVVAAAPSFAQDTLAKKVTIDVNAATPASVFKAVATASGANFTVTVDPAVIDPVDITIRNVTVKTALNAICESIGCRWTLTGSTLVVTPSAGLMIGVVTPPGSGPDAAKSKAAAARTQVVLDALKQKLPADLNFQNAPFDVVDARLSEVLKMKVELVCMHPSVKTITLDFGGRTLQSALQALGQQQDAKGAWRLTIGPQAGDTQTPSIAIMVGSKPAKKR
jgi:type II secretory pathway component GspD/PulD (secretin)